MKRRVTLLAATVLMCSLCTVPASAQPSTSDTIAGLTELSEDRPKQFQLRSFRQRRPLLAIAVRLLPSSERDRYFEEFGAELLDVPCGTRLRHALSLLRGNFVLRLRCGHKNKRADAAVRRAKG